MKRGKQHKMRGTDTYNSWRALKRRGRPVCARWCNPDGFIHFLEDMGLRPPDHDIHRIDNSRGYDPDNCEWLDSRQHRTQHAICRERDWHGRFEKGRIV